MSNQDLSLLTDERLRDLDKEFSSIENYRPVMTREEMHSILRVLIAARAENKRKDAVINRIMNGLENIHDIARRSLQSEKGE